MKPDYYCKECAAEVKVNPDGMVTRVCEHSQATIVAERTSALFGEGDAAEQSLYARATVALAKIVKAFT